MTVFELLITIALGVFGGLVLTIFLVRLAGAFAFWSFSKILQKDDPEIYKILPNVEAEIMQPTAKRQKDLGKKEKRK